jgi:flagellar hook-length control protein FliK
MAVQLPSIGASVKALGNSAVPVGLSFRGSSKSSGFAAQINLKLQDLSDSSDILSQLAGLLQSGTPMSTIVDKVSTELSKAIAKASGKGDDVDAQRTLQRALANALAPPGSSPPSDFKTQVATLVQQVNDILTKLTSQLNTAGQKSEFSGQVLDAEKARELPAQQTKPTTGIDMPAGMAPFVQSLLQRVAAQLQSVQPEKTQQVSSATPALPDPLARMLARAANANVQRGGEPVTKPAVPTTNGTSASSTLFQRLIAIIAERNGTQSDSNTGKESQDRTFGSSALSTSSTQPQSSVPAAPGFASQVASAPAMPVHSSPASATPYTAIDPQSVIEQVVKGIVIRTSGGTSEVRMRLQPEHLGDVSLKITVNGNTINANIVAQNADVRDTLLANQQQLARTLSEAGLSLGSFSVDVSGGNAGFTDQRAQQQQPKLSRIGTFTAALNGENDNWADSRFGPPVLSGSKALVLNYLA